MNYNIDVPMEKEIKLGINGITPHIGDNGNWFLDETDTGIKAQGPQGDRGEPGKKGDTGNGVLACDIMGDELLVTYTNGSRVPVGKVVGPQGDSGVGISDIVSMGSTSSGGNNYISIETTDGKSYDFTIKNGKDGAPGKDYILTDSDKDSIANDIIARIDNELLEKLGSGVL